MSKNRRRSNGTRPDRALQSFVDGSTIKVTRNGRLLVPGGGAGPEGPPGDDGGPIDATFLVLSAHADLTVERVATAGKNVSFDDAGANSTLTINGFSTTGRVRPSIGAQRTCNTAFQLLYVPSLDKLFMTEGMANGKLRYIDRITDAPVDLATHTSRALRSMIHSPVSGCIYCSYATSTLSLDETTGALVTDAIAVRADGGYAIRPSTGIIYAASGAGTTVYLDPASDTSPGSKAAVGFPVGGPFAIAYCPTNDAMYTAIQDGTVTRHNLTADTLTNFACFTGGSNVGSLCYSAVTDLIYVVNRANSNLTLKTIAPGADAVANTYAFPPGYVHTNGGDTVFAMGNFLYIGTTSTSTPCAMMLVFDMVNAAFVDCICYNTGASDLRGYPVGGVAAEGVLYVGLGTSSSGNSILVPFGR